MVRDPITRAEALFRLREVAIGDGNEPKPSNEFLMSMMELREELEELKESASGEARTKGLAALEETAQREMAALEEKLVTLFATPRSKDETRSSLGLLGELRYATRILSEIERIREDAEG